MFRGNAKCPGQCRDCKFVTRLRKRETQKVAAVISVSDFTLREHISRGYFSRVPIKRTIYNSATAEKITSSKNREGPLRLGFLGRLEVFKGLDVLLKALSRISVEKVSLKIAGIGPSGYVNYLVSKWPLPNAEYLGLIDPIELWSEIDVLVVPSIYYDPAPRVVLEAIAHGIPVLGNTYGGMSELIEEEKTGWICNLSHPDSLQERIDQLVANPERCREMRRGCLNSANRFSPKEMVNRHVELYEHLLA